MMRFRRQRPGAKALRDEYCCSETRISIAFRPRLMPDAFRGHDAVKVINEVGKEGEVVRPGTEAMQPKPFSSGD
jgi:hypothetical protein